MRGVDLDRFEFDYDLTWCGLMLNGDGKVLGRYGGRDADSSEGRLSLAGLRFALEAAAKADRQTADSKSAQAPSRPRTAEQFQAARRLKDNACIHCHHVYDFRREELQRADKWRLDEVWVYPLPENIGLTLDVEQGNRVRAVQPDSAAARAGLKPDDVVLSMNELRIASIADVQAALQRAPAVGTLPISWQHEGKTLTGKLDLRAGWRKTDVSWRWSLRGIGPTPPVHGDDLTATEKRDLGLPEDRLALRQGNFLATEARQAGLRQNDIIIGVDRQELRMTARQFAAYLRLNYLVGDLVNFQVLRAGQKIDVPIKLTGKTPF